MIIFRVLNIKDFKSKEYETLDFIFIIMCVVQLFCTGKSIIGLFVMRDPR